MIVVVVGMHRSGSSMVASLCQALGVDMGDRLLGGGLGNPTGHFEDMEFYKLNMALWICAGGNWVNPPSRQNLLNAAREMRPQIDALLGRRLGRRAWGWKDPRNCLTLELFLDLFAERGITDVRIVQTQRARQQVIKSLLKRSGHTGGQWSALIDTYAARVELALLKYDGFFSKRIIMRYAALVNRFQVRAEVGKLAQFLDCYDGEKIGQAVRRIRLKV